MFKLNDYLKILDSYYQDNHVTINLTIDEQKIHDDVKMLKETLMNFKEIVKKNFSITVIDDDIIIMVEDI